MSNKKLLLVRQQLQQELILMDIWLKTEAPDLSDIYQLSKMILPQKLGHRVCCSSNGTNDLFNIPKFQVQVCLLSYLISYHIQHKVALATGKEN